MKEMMYEGRPVLESLSDLEDLWVFGYGSLIWNPGFDSVEDRVGYIEDYSRKFWQGNVTHRGTPSKVGRVVTLVKQSGSRVWGKAYRVVGTDQISKCLEHLGVRECLLGGYDMDMIDFIPHNGGMSDDPNDISDIEDDSDNFPSPLFDLDDVFTNDAIQYNSRSSQNDKINIHSFQTSVEERQKIQTLVFIALPENNLFLGPASSEEMADCFMTCVGANGSNLDYMLGILDFLQDQVPSEELIHERDLFEIERHVWFQVQSQNLEVLARCHGGFLKPDKIDSLSDEMGFSGLRKAINCRRLRHRTGMFTPLLDTIKTAVLLKNSFSEQSSFLVDSSPALLALNVQSLLNNPSSLSSSFVSDGESLIFSEDSNTESIEEENGWLVPCFCRSTAISLPRRTEEGRL